MDPPCCHGCDAVEKESHARPLLRRSEEKLQVERWKHALKVRDENVNEMHEDVMSWQSRRWVEGIVKLRRCA